MGAAVAKGRAGGATTVAVDRLEPLELYGAGPPFHDGLPSAKRQVVARTAAEASPPSKAAFRV